MANLSLSNVINVTLVPSARGLSEFKTSNLLLYTADNPIVDFNEDFRIYKNASSVAEDFGVNSITYAMAVAVFSQSPNILSNSGALIIALKKDDESQVEAFNRLKSKVLFCGWMSTLGDINENEPSREFMANIRATEDIADVETIKAIENPTLVIGANISDESSSTSENFKTIEFDFSEAENMEDIKSIITNGLREAFDSDQWEAYSADFTQFGIVCHSPDVQTIAVGDSTLTQALKIDSASNPENVRRDIFVGLPNVVNAENNKINFVVSNDTESIEYPFKELAEQGMKKTRCLYYGGTFLEAKVMMAAYASRAMSTIFEASLTTQTMHLKELAGVVADPSMTETLLKECKDSGVDTYVSIEGVPCVFTSGANSFFDEVFNELWFVNAIQVAGFNYLKQTGTKIPQNERGMDGLKNAYAQVCVRGVDNGFLGAGSWTSPDTFGNPDTFKRNIESSGYYIYSTPIAQQTKADREDRKAPLVQIAIKTAGAIHSTDVMIYVNL